MKHILGLEIPNVANTCILRVQDLSVYDPLLPTDCPVLQVTPPGFNYPIDIQVDPGFTENLTACDLGLQRTNCDSPDSLSDGIYIIRYSLAPNDKVYVEYNHLRITLALNKYQKLLCCIQKTINCDPSPQVKAKINQAGFIKTLLDAAKAQVEYCHQSQSGVQTYRYSMDLLDKMLCSCGCSDC